MSDTEPRVSPILAGLASRCPRCGKGHLFKGYLRIADSCDVCGTELTDGDTADGPAVFVILIVGCLVVGGALVVEVAVMPPIWVHVVLWLPTTLAVSLGLLRPLKGVFYALHYRHIRGES